MIKSLVAAAALTIGLAGYAVAQEAAPAGGEMHHEMHHHHYHHHHHHHYHHHHNHMHQEMAPGSEAPHS